MNLSHQFQDPQDFLTDFKNRINQARHRVWLQAMVVESGEVMAEIEPLLHDALARGVEVRLYYDWVTQVYFHGEIRLTPVFDPEQRRLDNELHEQNRQLFDRLRSAGALVVEMNRPPLGRHMIPVMGRNHIKIYVADDVAWMGGMNFFDLSFAILDFMVRFEDRVMVDALCAQFTMVNANRPKADYECQVSPYGTLIVDAGRKGKSLIYSHALAAVAQASQEIIFASQLVPENHMLELLLRKAAAGVAVTIYTSDESEKPFNHYPLKYFYQQFKRRLEKEGQSIRFVHLDNKIHAKLIIVDRKEACFGSHNFVESGVRMGTQEICLRTQHSVLVRDLLGFVTVLEGFVPDGNPPMLLHKSV